MILLKFIVRRTKTGILTAVVPCTLQPSKDKQEISQSWRSPVRGFKILVWPIQQFQWSRPRRRVLRQLLLRPRQRVPQQLQWLQLRPRKISPICRDTCVSYCRHSSQSLCLPAHYFAANYGDKNFMQAPSESFFTARGTQEILCNSTCWKCTTTSLS